MNGLRLALLALLLIPTLAAAEEEEPLEAAGFIFDRYPSVDFSAPEHFFVSISTCDNGDLLLKLKDGSSWKIHQYDSNKVLFWRENDALIITENQRLFSNYSYRIIHKATGSYVEANPFTNSF